MKKVFITSIISLFVAMGSFAQIIEVIEIIDSGECGENLTWELDGNGVLSIYGTGAMTDYYFNDNPAPWRQHDSLIKTLVIEAGITHIGDVAFHKLPDLTGNIVIPRSVKSIGHSAFSESYKLNGVLRLGELVETIANRAFWGCPLTGELILPNSLKTIGSQVFMFCEFSGDLVIPNSVTSIGDNMFFGSNFSRIVSRSTTPPSVVSMTFNRVDKSIPLYVPYGTVAAYQAAEGWGDFTTITDEEYSSVSNSAQLQAGVYAAGNGVFTIDAASSEKLNVTVVNMHGQVVKTGTAQGSSLTINIASQPAGIYVFVVDDGTRETTVKVVKQQE